MIEILHLAVPMMRLRATVRTVTGRTRHLLGMAWPSGIEITRVPDPVAVEVVEQDGAFLLLRLDRGGDCVADTWHATLDGAKRQANLEFAIEEGDWKEG